jgi:hypothetical protein
MHVVPDYWPARMQIGHLNVALGLFERKAVEPDFHFPAPRTAATSFSTKTKLATRPRSSFCWKRHGIGLVRLVLFGRDGIAKKASNGLGAVVY